MFNFLDVVKWAGCLNETELHDVMVVEDCDSDFVTVRHIQNNQISKEREVNLRYAGKCSAYEPTKDIYERYKNA